MLDYRITSLADLNSTLKDFNATHLISLVDTDMSAPATPTHLHGRHLVLFMHDLDVVDDGGRPGNPHSDHVSDILGFAIDHLTDDGVRAVFQCTAGRRRSAAAALLSDLMVRTFHGQTPTDAVVTGAWDRMIALRSIADPNKALLALGDCQMNANGAVMRCAESRPRFLTLDPSDDQDL